MNHSVAAAAAVAPTSIPTSISKPVSTPTPQVFDTSLVRSTAGWQGQQQEPTASVDVMPTVVHSAETATYNEDDDERLSLST